MNSLLECGRTTHGFVDNSLRRKVWPIVLCMRDSDLMAESESFRKLSERSLKRHSIDKDTIRKDADRSFVNLKGITEDSRSLLQAELNKVLCSLIDRNNEIGYVQGLNDVVGVFMLILGKEHALLAAERVCLHYIKDMLLETFDEGMMPILRLVLKIIQEADSELHENLFEAVQDTPGFALAWILTWMSHELTEIDVIARVFDYLICSHPVTPAYLAAAKKEKIMEIEEKSLADYYMLFKELDMGLKDMEKLLEDTTQLMNKVAVEKAVSKIRGELYTNSPIVSENARIGRIYTTKVARGKICYVPFKRKTFYSVINDI